MSFERKVQGGSTSSLVKRFKTMKGKLTKSSHDDIEESEYVDSPAMHYVQFQTIIIKLFSSFTKKKLTTKSAFTQLILCKELFTHIADNEYQLCLDWPYYEGCRRLLISAFLNDEEHSKQPSSTLKFFYQDKHFLTMTSLASDSISVEKRLISSNHQTWSSFDMDAIVHNFNEALRAKKIIYTHKKSKHDYTMTIDKASRQHFNKDEFEKIVQEYDTEYLTYRISNSILKQSSMRNNYFVFYLHWPDSHDIMRDIKVTFSRADLFYSPVEGKESGYSWILSEETLLNSFPDYAGL